MKIVNTAKTIATIGEGRLDVGMDRDALLYVLSFVSPKARAIAARQAYRSSSGPAYVAERVHASVDAPCVEGAARCRLFAIERGSDGASSPAMMRLPR